MKLNTISFSTIVKCMILLWSTAQPLGTFAQGRTFTLDEAIDAAIKGNAGLRSVALDVDVQKQYKKVATEVPKTQAMLMYGQYNSLNKDNNVTITQSIPFPTVFTSQAKLGKLRILNSEYRRAASENELVYQVKQVYHHLQYLMAVRRLLQRQDSIFSDLVRISSLQLTTGEGTLLQKTSAETRYNEVQNLLHQNEADSKTFGTQLQILLNAETAVSVVEVSYQPLSAPMMSDSSQVNTNPQLSYHRSLHDVALQEKRVESNKALPDLTVGYFNQTLIGFQQQLDGTDRYFSSNDRFSGLMVGVAIPIWFVPTKARVKASALRAESERYNFTYFEKQLRGEWHRAIQQFTKHQNSLDYYMKSALPNARLILKQSLLAYKAGDISQAEYRLNLQQSLAIEDGYLQTVLQYNHDVIELEYLSGKYSKN
ncbi:MAG: TolC family protein [Cyclobacteriaceae bacterium]|nr:TolC family protein [Cyclobacteriaceae bacterium]